jgi:hypothetical protein
VLEPQAVGRNVTAWGKGTRRTEQDRTAEALPRSRLRTEWVLLRASTGISLFVSAAFPAC